MQSEGGLGGTRGRDFFLETTSSSEEDGVEGEMRLFLFSRLLSSIGVAESSVVVASASEEVTERTQASSTSGFIMPRR
eukprot:CAMPEP_0118663170 /NCGR_PEP_ID=MMETSP0785-20121206/17261_1 /TAXON_ID=91992 /ORGANISM="Bolidomonas pacifica, Strain CCMP 1866" /LENGTH=77 /DNA_ID=CAMNT_0006556841 /DNA_START=321 /DNA_END=554 /DNA_ORIENTATION=+